MKTPDMTKFTPPSDIKGEARKEWGRVCAELGRLGRLTSVDRGILTVHCTAWAMHRQAADTVDADGPSCVLPNGCPAQTPAFKAWKETATMLRGTLADLGLTPASRKAIAAAQDDDEPAELDV